MTAKQFIESQFNFSPSVNQLKEINRLIFEICRRENIEAKPLFNEMTTYFAGKKITGSDRFIALRKILFERRFPITAGKTGLKPAQVFITPLNSPIKKKYPIQKNFIPEKIFIERACVKSELSCNIQNTFPDVPTELIPYRHEYIKNYRFDLGDLKRPLLFIVQESFDHIKPCPCTTKHIRCGYWILNLGFGCPFDCSYCYLQHYSNSPGMILPANIEDFFAAFDKISANLAQTIRIGTGEFTDSLALDHITDYSKKLIPYFKNKNVIFELKTKSANIKNLLAVEAVDNCVIAWSLNTEKICSKEELGAATLNERLLAAQKCQCHNYKLAFHFDPIIYAKNWQGEYQKTIEKIYAKVKPPFAWISLGTLRSNRELKTACEKRFPKSDIFYGELLLSNDKKLRYPHFLREEIYLKIIKMIRDYDQTTPLYLCMETEEMWKNIGTRYPLTSWHI